MIALRVSRVLKSLNAIYSQCMHSTSASAVTPVARHRHRDIQVLQLPSLQKTNLSPNALPLEPVEPLPLTTPLLKEIRALQSAHPDHLLLVQVGSFYEIYESCGKLEQLSHLLNLRIAKKKLRQGDVLQFAGFPCARVHEYLDLLLRNGFTVALANQTGKDDASKTKNFVRTVTRIVTPGTLQSDADFEKGENRFLLALSFLTLKQKAPSATKVGMAWGDVSTGEFYLSETTLNRVQAELARIQPAEVLLPESVKDLLESDNHLKLRQLFGPARSDRSFHITFNASVQNQDALERLLLSNDPIKSAELASTQLLDSFTPSEIQAGSALLGYIGHTFPSDPPLFRKPHDVTTQSRMVLDSVTLQALEICKTNRGGTKRGSLLHVIDKTVTAAGGRLLALRLRTCFLI